MTVEFTVRTSISAPAELVFDLARDIDAHRASMADSCERAIGGVTTGLIGPGEHVTWRATHFCVPFRMTSRVAEFRFPDSFVDEQERGPFRRFRHEHLFDTDSDATVMIDLVSFDAPFGPVGRVVEAAVLARYMEQLIRKRADHLKQEAERRHHSGDG